MSEKTYHVFDAIETFAELWQLLDVQPENNYLFIYEEDGDIYDSVIPPEVSGEGVFSFVNPNDYIDSFNFSANQKIYNIHIYCESLVFNMDIDDETHEFYLQIRTLPKF